MGPFHNLKFLWDIQLSVLVFHKGLWSKSGFGNGEITWSWSCTKGPFSISDVHRY